MTTRNEFYLFKTGVLTLLLWLTGNITVFSQNYLFDIEHIGVEKGLPHRSVYDITQDKEGFIWIGTLGNISRYDGYSFKTYGGSLLNMSENTNIYLAADVNNYIWFYENGSASGIIDPRLDSIYSVETISKGLLSGKDIRHISNSREKPDDVFIATHSGIIYKYNGSFEAIYRTTEFPLGTFIGQEAPDGSYWIVKNREILHIKDGKHLKTIPVPDEIHKVWEITSLHPDVMLRTYGSDGSWILKNNRFIPFITPGHEQEHMRRAFGLRNGNKLYAVKDTLFIRDRQGNIIYHFNEFDAPQYGGQFTGIQNVFSDRQNNIWIATGNGILKLSSKKNPFTVLRTRSVRGIYREGNRLWIGSSYNNAVINTTDGTQKKFWELSGGAMAISFHKDEQGHLWIGTGANVMLEYIPDEDTYITYELPLKQGFRVPFQNSITRNYWIGTEKGLYRFNKQSKTVVPYELPVNFEKLYIRQLYQNAKGIWIATNRGIFLMDARNETIIKHYTKADGLPDDNINHIYEDRQGIFWVGTKRDGLLRWDVSQNTIHQYNRKDGFSSSNIYAVYEDDYNTLWLPSDYGLMAFDKETATVKVYLPQNGIAHEEFNTHAHFQAADGTLYFGGLGGVTSFHPKDLQEAHEVSAPLHINKVRILEKDAETLTDNTATYLDTKKIGLNSSDRILELELTLLDYERSAQNQYAYKLAGKQEQWIYTTDNTLSIINPPYGRYDLVVKARGASGNWSADALTIPVYKPLPFYRQWWFITAVILFIALAVIIIVRQRVQKLQKDKKRLKIEVQKRTRQIEQDKKIIEKDKETIEQQAEELKALDKAKNRFFANITHEFRTPLTLVKGPIEQIIANPPAPDKLKKILGNVSKNTDNLLELINQLLDLSKLEGGKMKVEISHGDIVHYTKELVQRFKMLANHKMLTLEFKTDKDKWKTHFDTDKWSKILHNLLSNAIKFTPEGGKINVKLQQLHEKGQEYTRLQVSDTGIGIKAESLEHVFDRFYQVDGSATRVQGGTGVGLSLVKELAALQNGSVTVASNVNKGTSFLVKIPVTKEQDVKEALLLSSQTNLPLPVPGETWPEYGNIPGNSPGATEKLQLLIIEDNAEMRAYIRSCINTLLYNVAEAADGEEGITKAQEIVPDLIISDVMMPKKDGFEVVEAIRAHIATSHIPLILLTAKAALESRLEGISRGADAYLTKPFNPEELVLRIQKLIELRRLLQRRYQSGQLPETNVTFEKEDGFVNELKNYITAHITDPYINTDVISRHFNMSRIQLYRKLKALVNKPVADYIRFIRLEKGMALLKEKQLTVTEVAYATGFSSLSHFSKNFKKAYGKSPSNFRKH